MTQAQEVLDSITKLRDECYEVSKSKGWWDDDKRTFGDFISLMHSELSEALEEFRNGHIPTEIYYANKDIVNMKPFSKPEGIPIELADVIIRIMDFCGGYNIDIASALDDKIRYNKTRPHRHGGKVL